MKNFMICTAIAILGFCLFVLVCHQMSLPSYDEMIKGIPLSVQQFPDGERSGWYCGVRICNLRPMGNFLIITKDTIDAEQEAKIRFGDYRSGWLPLVMVNDSLSVSLSGDWYEYAGTRFLVSFIGNKPTAGFILEYVRSWDGWVIPGSGGTTRSLSEKTFVIPYWSGDTFDTYPASGSERVETPDNLYQILEAGDDSTFIHNLQMQKKLF